MGLRGPKPGWKAAKARAEAQTSSAKKPPAAKPVPKRVRPKRAVKAPAPGALQGAPLQAPLSHAVQKIPAERPLSELSAAERNNPANLNGQALREFAHKKGMPRSTVADMPDFKIREQLRYIEAHRLESAEA